MTQVKLDPARLVQDGDALFGIARTLDGAISTLESRLGSSSGMAGDDNAAEEFCEGSDGYDALAGPTIDAVRSFGNALRIMDSALVNTSRAYDGAQKAGAGLPGPAGEGETATIDQSKATPPSALGAGWPGPLGEFQEFLEWGLQQIGVVIPTGDEDKLQAASQAWGDFASSIRSAKTQVSSSLTNVSAMTLPQQGAILSCRQSVVTGLGTMLTSAEGMRDWIADFRSQLRQMREELGWFLKQMAIEIAAELAIGGLLSIVTVGIGALATAAKVTTTVIRWCVKIAKLIDRLKDFLRGIRGVKGALIRGGIRAGREGLQAGLASTIATASVNHWRAGEEGYEAQSVGVAFVSAFVGGAAASPASRLLGGSGGPGFRAGLREVAGETGAGALDGLASSAVESGMTGTEFNPISGMVLGALLGGTLAGAGRGVQALRPGSSSGTSAPTSPGEAAPTPAGGNGSGMGTQGGNGVDTDASGVPTPGTAGGGSSNQGGGAAVDTDASGVPTPGAGDGGGSNNAGGPSVDVSGDAPTAPGGLDAGSGSSGADAGAPAAPEVSAPAGPEGSGSSGADAGAPAAPEVSAPAGAEGSGSSGADAGAPAAPAAPEGTTPAAPEGSSVAQPEVPTVDGSGSQSTGDGTAPAAVAPAAVAGGHAADIPTIDIDLDVSLTGSPDGATPARAAVDGGTADGGTADGALLGDATAPDAAAIDAAAADGSSPEADGSTPEADGSSPEADGQPGDAEASATDSEAGAPTPEEAAAAAAAAATSIDSGQALLDQVLPESVRDQIIATDKGSRPDPATYLPAGYIDGHLGKFEGGATRFMTQSNLDKYGIAQRDGTAFVMPKQEVDALIDRTGGDPRAMEDALGLPQGFFDGDVVRVDIVDPDASGLRMPSGNEAGANDQWLPGGMLPGDFSEAVIDGGALGTGDYTVSSLDRAGAVLPDAGSAAGAASAIAAGAAAMVGRPGFLPAHTGGGGTPAAPKPAGAAPAAAKPATATPASPNGADGGAPRADGADGTASADGSTADAGDAGSNGDGSANDGAANDGSANDGAANDGSANDGSGTDADGDKPDTTENNRTERTTEELDRALAEINPNYDPSDPANGYATNCGNTAAILNDFLNGSPTSEAPTGTLDVSEMEARTGMPQTPMTPAQIDASLRAMGPGSHCVVGIDRSTGDGHWFNAFYDGTKVWSIDAQTGSRSPWPPNEPHATTWDASIDPANKVDPTPPAADGSAAYAPSADGSAPAGASPDAAAPAHGSAADARTGNPWQSQATVQPDHASDGSQGPGRTFNGYDIPDLTREMRAELDALAAQPKSPIVRNADGSYSLKTPIKVDPFNLTNAKHDWVEFQRQVGLQQQGLNNLTVAEWQHNIDFYDTHRRVAKSEQDAANGALAAAGVPMTGKAVLHGPDQVAGGRADRFDGAGNFGINSSLGTQWKQRVNPLGAKVDAATLAIEPRLLAHIKLNVELGAVNVRDGGGVASQSALLNAKPVLTGQSSTPGTAPAAAAAGGATTSGTRTPSGSSPSTSSSAGTRTGAASRVTPDSAPSGPVADAASGSGSPDATSPAGADGASGPGASPATAPAADRLGDAPTGDRLGDSSTGDSVEGGRGDRHGQDAVDAERAESADHDASDVAGQETAAPDSGTGAEPADQPGLGAGEGPGAGNTPDSAPDRVPERIHHEVLDRQFPHLRQPESTVQSVTTVNHLGSRMDKWRFGFNCHYVVNALELRFRGYDTIASPTVQTTVYDPRSGQLRDGYEVRFPYQMMADWVQADGSRRDFENLSDHAGGTAMDALQSLTASWPEGGRGFIAGYWRTGGGHIFTVVKERDGVKLYDGQSAMLDASDYLDEMHFNERSSAPWKDVTVVRVDDLIPTDEIVKTAKPWTVDEAQLLDEWGSAPSPSQRPRVMIDREIVANARWRTRNDELIAERLRLIQDPATSPSTADRARSEIDVLRDQNMRLSEGSLRFQQSHSPSAPGSPSAGGTVLGGYAAEPAAGRSEPAPAGIDRPAT